MTDTRRNYRGRLWLGEYPLTRKTILLTAEQGLGDSIQFARYAPLLARTGARVLLEVQAELKPLMATLAGAAAVHARGESLPAYDVHCPLGSLPLALKTEAASIPADIPYLAAEEARLARWRPMLEALPGKRIAFAWAGHARHPNDRNRSIDLKLWAPLLAREGISFVSIQRDLRDEDARELAELGNVTHVGDTARRHGRHRRGDCACRSDDCGRHLGRPSRRRAGAPRLGAAAVLARLALDAVRRAQPLVSAARGCFASPAAGDWPSVLAQVESALDDFSAAPESYAAARIASGAGATGWLLSQSRAARWARPISPSLICSAISRRSRAASGCPCSAAMLNHLCASTRSTATPAPAEWIMP